MLEKYQLLQFSLEKNEMKFVAVRKKRWMQDLKKGKRDLFSQKSVAYVLKRWQL